jgi:Xaa-Pro dipeptidase
MTTSRIVQFESEEFLARRRGLADGMARSGIDAVLVMSETNYRYFAGFSTQFWVSPTRPWYLLVTADAKATAVIPDMGRVALESTAVVDDIRSWPSPRPADEGVTLLAETIEDLGIKVLAVEQGQETRLGMPLADYERLASLISPATIADAAPLIWSLRAVKSAAEVEQIRQVCLVGNEIFERVPEVARVGATEREIYRTLASQALHAGADTVSYLPVISGRDGYSNAITGPTDQALRHGDTLYIDAGLVINGYFCDFNRNWVLGEASTEILDAYAAVSDAVDVGLAAVRPGRLAGQIWQAMADHLAGFGEIYFGSRMGHGVGLCLTEPPSISPNDRTEIRPGMVLAIEPGLMVPGGILIHEENIEVTDDGYRLLTERAAPRLPVIPA